ncbi:MAG: ABC transporter ATP-binding protein [Bryobacteraceae bacterium]|nr:ABC transporter ATP-binding protein [Bryobacteraceae bacterium]
MIFRLSQAGMNYGAARVLADVSAEFVRPEFVAVLGPNGAGKSTLMGILAGVKPGYTGLCEYRGKSVPQWPRRDFAREVSFLPQNVQINFPFSAEEIVLMGRTPHGRGWQESPADLAAAKRAMELTDASNYRCRDFVSLSGGERQRVILAAALAQTPRVLLLDEPSAFLDLSHQVALYRLLARLPREEGMLVIAVTHDLNLAAAHADRLLILHQGQLSADGAPMDVLNEACLRDVFNVDAVIQQNRASRPVILYE